MWSGSVSCSCTIRSRTHLFRYALASAKSIGAKRIESARDPHVWHQDFPLRQSARYLAITGVSAQNHTPGLILRLTSKPEVGQTTKYKRVLSARIIRSPLQRLHPLFWFPMFSTIWGICFSLTAKPNAMKTFDSCTVANLHRRSKCSSVDQNVCL